MNCRLAKFSCFSAFAFGLISVFATRVSSGQISLVFFGEDAPGQHFTDVFLVLFSVMIARSTISSESEVSSPPTVATMNIRLVFLNEPDFTIESFLFNVGCQHHFSTYPMFFNDTTMHYVTCKVFNTSVSAFTNIERTSR